ncbi:composite domain of metallo-dependent hydrolase [Stereum hirsutum FP-91666 SS1]|uniref:composite domain of metallo-dependent hydrolase n=1 Tax=Stereum hirsutum (strain FP-91666) TaxID=721885 RepID=UPI000440B742|nr:composite domain of metallo-dependent hydrolase [Stereum hirsutum FP-91666 SS1]EIM86583.1 composite domain of metallo-dependent hydrolase [Stereum hirsutum FP-91666 SS1]
MGQMVKKTQSQRSRLFSLTLYAIILTTGFTLTLTAFSTDSLFEHGHHHCHRLPLHAQHILNKCSTLNAKPAPPPDFYERGQSDRFVRGTKPTLIRNATLWTGAVDGLETIRGDLLMEGGIIKAVGNVDAGLLKQHEAYESIDAKGAWITPGIIDIHSHLGVFSSPSLSGSGDGNSFKGTIQPWLRALDGLNTHDEGMKLAIAGGVTTSLILPGSANAIGGQGFVIKLRPTEERSTSAMLLEPPFEYNGTGVYPSEYPRWRHMKHACARIYDDTRMDSVWAWRQAYDTARKFKKEQDDFCAAAQAGRWDALEGKSFPENLQWEAMVDILRGKVKVQTHCYEAVDFDNFVRLTNEFQFSVAAFHHAHEAYLVPEILKRAYGPTPAVAIFSVFSRYKRESSRASVFAAKVLNEAGIRVTMKSDHPAIQSRYLLHEAQQAHHYGLPSWAALAAVTSTGAGIIGMDHRIGYLKEGYDADLVIWDSHPLSLGATPTQTYIDGIAQLPSPHTITSPKSSDLLHAPKVPNYDKEAEKAVRYEGLPPLMDVASLEGTVVFRNVSRVYKRVPVEDVEVGGVGEGVGVREVTEEYVVGRALNSVVNGDVLVRAGRLIPSSLVSSADIASTLAQGGVRVMNVGGGSLSPALVGAGTSIGLQEIAMEDSTVDGDVWDIFIDGGKGEGLLGNETVIRAVDGLQFATRDALLSYRNGVTTALTSPTSSGFLSGLGVAFSLGTPHKLAKGAVVQDVTALHVAIDHQSVRPSVSTEISALRRLLVGGEGWWGRVVKGEIPLVVHAQNADIIATLLRLKHDVEASGAGTKIKMTILGGTEAHLLAKEIKEAGVGVIVAPVRSYPYSWEDKRIMPGRPLSAKGLVPYLLEHGIEVGIAPQGIDDFTPAMAAWAVQNLRFDAGWLVSDGLPTALALSLASSNVDNLMGVHANPEETDLVVTRDGGLLEFEGKVVAVISPGRGVVDVF